MNEGTPPFHVVTGGPGAGKSTLLAALADAGYAVAEEAGRAVIKEQQASGGEALPWGDRAAFAQAMLTRDLAAYAAHRAATEPVFFDRGIPDVVGYLRLEGLPVPETMLRAALAHRYDRVFICPPWPEIYVTDVERKQTPEVAARTYAAMVESYGSLGYALVEVLRLGVAQRARFVREIVEASR